MEKEQSGFDFARLVRAGEGADANEDFAARRLTDWHLQVRDRVTGHERLLQDALERSREGLERLAQNLLGPEAGDAFGGAVESGDPSFTVHGDHAAGEASEEHFRHERTSLSFLPGSWIVSDRFAHKHHMTTQTTRISTKSKIWGISIKQNIIFQGRVDG